MLNKIDLIWLVPLMLCAIMLMIPSRYDPTIRFKEWFERDRK
jgi:hypothetical protein